jgi:hypothetical protein
MRNLLSLKKKIKRTFVKRGVRGTITHSFHHIQYIINPSVRKDKALKKYQLEEFDRKYGLDTSGLIPITDLAISSKNWIYGGMYEPVGLIDFGKIFKDLKIAYDQFNFVDLGSGKGLACLLASTLPFKKIIGVEFSEELNDIAKDNYFHFQVEEQNCRDSEFICMDASEYIFPNDPFILYMYNPFEPPVMSQVRDNVIRAYKKRPRQIVVVYYYPAHSYLWDEVSFLKKIDTTSKYCLYVTR